jgi:hypothetical protein
VTAFLLVTYFYMCYMIVLPKLCPAVVTFKTFRRELKKRLVEINVVRGWKKGRNGDIVDGYVRTAKGTVE